jgi:hypothetical protein
MTEEPGYGPDQIVHGLTLRRRIGHIAAGLGGFAGATVISVLWATEPDELPARTQVAFAAMVLTGMAWVVFALIALVRRPLFAIDRVVAAWLAVAFSALMTVGLVVITATRADSTVLATAAGLGLSLTTLAAAMLVRAHTYRTALLTRMRTLEAQSDPTTGGVPS